MRRNKLITTVLLILFAGTLGVITLAYPSELRGVTRKVDHVTARRENAALVTLCRNSELREMLGTIASVEAKFNQRFHYDWIFLNDEEFSENFKTRISAAVSGRALFGLANDWGYPSWIDLEKAGETREWMREHNVRYGDLESYHHMCRFFSGPFFHNPLLKHLRYYWRVEPAISLECVVKHDPFALMRQNELLYGFTVAPKDIPETIPSIWNVTMDYLRAYPQYLDQHNMFNFLTDDNGETYNTCHFWTNFEIADLDFFRSKPYQKYFEFLDKAGGFYYERWGDAPVHSLAVSLLADQAKIHFFNDIGYFHDPYGHCPWDQGVLELECDCEASQEDYNNKFYDWHENSCLRNYFTAKGKKFKDPNPISERQGGNIFS